MEGAITAQRVKQAAREQMEELVALRRYLHENAEPSMEEKTASALVRQEAQRLGLPWESVGSMALSSHSRAGARGAAFACAPTWTRCV